MKLLVIFIILNIFNVIIQTVKSIATVKCGKTVASITNAIAYGLYTVVVVYTVCDLPLWIKVVVVSVANLIGVFVVKLIEEKTRKDKLWKVEVAIKDENTENMDEDLKQLSISHNYQKASISTVFNCYCNTQKETAKVIKIAKKYNGKFSAYENKFIF